MSKQYELIMMNKQGGSDLTYHKTVAEVRDWIRRWDARAMTARVFLDGKVIYEGRALSFRGAK